MLPSARLTLDIWWLLQIVLEYSPGAWEAATKWEEYPMLPGMLDLCVPATLALSTSARRHLQIPPLLLFLHMEAAQHADRPLSRCQLCDMPLQG